MSWEQAGVQLGVAGLVLVIVYRIAMVLIAAWQTNDLARTKAWFEGDKDRTAAIVNGFERVTDVHATMLAQQHDIAMRIVRLDTKVATALDLTPVHGTSVPPGVREAIETPSIPEPTVIVSESSARKTPPGGVKVPRHKTVG